MKKTIRFMPPFALLRGIWFVFNAIETMAEEHPNSETIRFVLVVLAGDFTVTAK